MFESLSEKLQSVFDRLGRKGRLNEEDVELALREVRVALLEADVSLKVVRQFVAAIKEKAVGQDVLHSLTPAQTVIKIVHDQLVELLGTSPPRLTVASKPPTVVMLVGLQGSGKTTTAGKLAVQIRKMGHKPLLVAADPYRPAAVTQLQTLGRQIDVPVFHEPNKKPPELAQAAVKYAEQNGLSFVVLDTAGRLQINEELMRELESITSKVSPHETLLVADAMTGQEAVRVAEGFLEQMSQLRKMAGGGGLTGLVEMLPGVGKALKEARQAGQAVDEKQFKRIEAIIQSMTLEERRRPEILGGSRKKRIASGSGTSAAEINQLLMQFRQMQTMMKQLSKGLPNMRGLGGLGGLSGGLPGVGGGLPSLPGLGNGAAPEMPALSGAPSGGTNRQHHKPRNKKKRRELVVPGAPR